MYKTQVWSRRPTITTAPGSRTRSRSPRSAAPSPGSSGLNEDLTEAIALSHDLGHPPFGHAGEQRSISAWAITAASSTTGTACGSSNVLEYRYADFPGLNLSWEVLEAQAQHSKRREAPEVREFTGAGQPLLEAQVVDAADSLAYDTHDIDDALSVGLIAPADLEERCLLATGRRTGARTAAHWAPCNFSRRSCGR